MSELRRICVACGSSAGRDERFGAAATELGTTLAHEGIGLVYGGARVGLMGLVADAALAAGGEVIGVIPRMLHERVGHPGLTRIEIVDSMHQRKHLFSELSDAYVVLPGGLGTLEELFEVVTWSQLGIHRKGCGVLDIGGYYEQLFAFIANATEQGFVRPEHAATILRNESVPDLLAELRVYEPPTVPKWVEE